MSLGTDDGIPISETTEGGTASDYVLGFCDLGLCSSVFALAYLNLMVEGLWLWGKFTGRVVGGRG